MRRLPWPRWAGVAVPVPRARRVSQVMHPTRICVHPGTSRGADWHGDR
jgi:hypothetical protein